MSLHMTKLQHTMFININDDITINDDINLSLMAVTYCFLLLDYLMDSKYKLHFHKACL